jgi:hypothetical protein
MLQYSKNAAFRRMKLDDAKQALEVVKAEVDKKIRKNPEKFGIEKITENVIAATILINEEYQEAYAEYLTAKYESDMASGAVQAFEQRKSALENLVKLHGQQYFAGPKIPRDLNWEREQRQKKVDEGIIINRKKRTIN